MSIKQRAEEGYIALIAVLIIGAASTAIALTLLIGGTDNQKAALVLQQSVQARALAMACAEDVLETLHETPAYTGTNSITLGQGNCTYTVTSGGGNARVIDTTGTVNGVVRKIKIYATITSSSISITSWQEVT